MQWLYEIPYPRVFALLGAVLLVVGATADYDPANNGAMACFVIALFWHLFFDD
ncbi:MAG: hypothetical protein Q8Q95_02665 [bacterium]|nr:hypothetical protein [bacterium]